MEIKVFSVENKRNVFYETSEEDTFDSVAKSFSVPKDYIKKHNAGELYRGKILYLPETNFTCYVVKPFETLKKIADDFGTTTEALREKNSLENDYVFIGQKIYI